jgi:hypothetical protein
MNRPISCLLALLPAVCALAGTNLHPDPSFERTGEPGVARTGQRAGHLKLGGQVHWQALGGKLPVEPFATYRATAYVRAKPGKGTLYALYVYAWNSFDWSWARSVPLGAIGEWKQVQVEFLSPGDTVQFHPLAAIDGANCEAWVDDVAVERIRTSGETMQAILAKPPDGPEDIALRVRYFVAKGEVAKARALAEGSTDYVKADAACVLARRSEDLAERLRLAAEMVRRGGLGYHNGQVRFAEITAEATAAERLGALHAGLAASGFAPAAARAYAAIATREIDALGEGATCGQLDTQLQQIEADLAAMIQRRPPDSPARKELDAVSKKLVAARAAAAQRRAELGSCVIRIGGAPIAPATHAIILPDQPTPQEKFAAQDLNAHLERLTGSDLPVVRDSKLAAQIPLVVGKCPKTLEKLGVQVDFEALGAEGIFLQTKGSALVLAGNRRGVLYAVYTLLEDHCGCRWFTPDCTVIPSKGTFEIPFLRVRYAPPLEYRSTDYPCSRDASWAVRNKINGTQTRLDERRGGKIAYSHFVHTFNAILNPAQHFEAHPEWFSMIKGKRTSGRTQLCLTNPEVLALAKQTVRRWIEESPEATIFSVSQNDWHNYCECPACSALAEKEGSQAGPIIHFCNAIARDIAQDYPDKLISTLAYQYTRTPPKHVRPEPNVCVRLCTIECDFAHPLDESTHPQNRKFVDDIRGWNQLCNRLYIWDYIIDYRHSVMPWPNLYVLRPNIRFFIDNGVKGLYEEACYFTPGSELAELRTWIIAKTMWNPEYDTDRAIDEFLDGYYGPAAKPVRRYINLIHKPVLEDESMHIHIWTHTDAPYLSRENVRQAVRLFDQAERAVADDPVRLHRVQVARLPVLYVQIMTAAPAYREKGDALVAARGPSTLELAEKFEAVARKERLTMIREHGGTGALGTWLKSLNAKGKELPIVRLGNDALELAVLPTVGGRIWKLVHKPTGREILKRSQDADGGEIPDAGGYEEYSEGEYRSPGWNEAYRVTKRSATSVTLQARLKNGLRLTRTITLDPAKPIVTINSSLTNAAKEPRRACLRSHPTFAIADAGQAFAAVRRSDGTWVRKPLIPADEPEKELDEFLAGDALPAGDWMLADPAAKLSFRSRFDPAQASQCLLNRSGKEGRANLEIYSKAVTLAPGESLSLRHSIEVVPGAAMPKP